MHRRDHLRDEQSRLLSQRAPKLGNDTKRATSITGREIHVDGDGFLTEYAEWDDDSARALAKHIGIELTEAHWKVIRFLRADYEQHGTTPTVRRVSAVGGVPITEMFTLFPGQPATRMAYGAGLPKPYGYV